MPTSTASSLDHAAKTTLVNDSMASPALMTTPSDLSHETTMPFSFSIVEDSDISSQLESMSIVSPDLSAPAFMTDEGSS